MRYIKVYWIHENNNDPNLLISEIDEFGYETRKVEVFPDGRLGFADSNSSIHGTILGLSPIPPNEEISTDPQFIASEIKLHEFECFWEKAKSKAFKDN